jgi:hypothetical protein
LLLNDTTHGLYVCEMNGTQLGTNAQAFRIDSPNGWHFQTLGDFNGDGKSDVLLSNDATRAVNEFHRSRNRRVKARGTARGGGWRRPHRAGAIMPCIHQKFA